MKHLLLFVSVLLVGAMSLAAQNSTRVLKKKVTQLQGLVAVGGEARLERRESQQTEPRTMPQFKVGAVFQEQWIGSFEYASFSETSGNATLSLSRKFESSIAWLHWQSRSYNLVTPYLGVGVGVIRETIDTTLLNQTDRDASEWSPVMGGAFGVRYFPKSWVWLATEGRVLKSSRLDPDPQLGALIQLGLCFDFFTR